MLHSSWATILSYRERQQTFDSFLVLLYRVRRYYYCTTTSAGLHYSGKKNTWYNWLKCPSLLIRGFGASLLWMWLWSCWVTRHGGDSALCMMNTVTSGGRLLHVCGGRSGRKPSGVFVSTTSVYDDLREAVVADPGDDDVVKYVLHCERIVEHLQWWVHVPKAWWWWWWWWLDGSTCACLC